jgi:hypothetical protein
VDRRELAMLVLSAKIRLAADYRWEPVAQQVRDALLDAFGFQRRALGQPALLCEVMSVMQAVPGVAYVDVDSFGGVPEVVTGADGTRRLPTLDEISQTVRAIVSPGSTQGLSQTSGPAQAVIVNATGFAHGMIRPAQLAVLTPAVPATLVLNQIQ